MPELLNTFLEKGSETLRIGFDLDGVIAECNVPLWLIVGRINKEEEIRKVIDEFMCFPKLRSHPREYLHEDDEYVIITGRSERFREITKKWLKSYGIQTSSLFMCSVGLLSDYGSIEKWNDALAKAKARYIKSECVDVFFEDNPKVVIRLRKLCPKVRIIQIGGRIK